ncbi:TfoX/Sxy family protein [Microbacterium enclense]|uniref:TfoX/Sxy family protein n=1 Tax=Microbacterium enclense TaxID=993073 RepID=UPI003D72DE83
MVDREAMARGRAIFDPIAERLCALPDVDMGRMFGTEGVRVRGKVFAFVAHEGALVVKLPEQRIGELTADGIAAPMIMRGRPLREWAEISLDAAETWPALIDEAHRFVDAITP